MTDWFWIGVYAGLGYAAVGVAFVLALALIGLVVLCVRFLLDKLGLWKFRPWW